jgi:toxin ParE1/3/4
MASGRFQVLLTHGAEQDLESIVNFIAQSDGEMHANHVLDGLAKVITSLANHPERGAFPPELLSLGIKEYRQAIFKPYRVVYRVIEKRVYVYLIADGRRNMQSLLALRLLGSV